jgi:hypothetical protein
MKESFIMGALIGAAVGVMIYKNSNEAKKLVDKGEQMIKQEIDKCKKNIAKAENKK